LKRTLDEKRGHLDVLYAKQGRLQRFRTKAERDAFLTSEIASLEHYRTTQSQALEKAQADVESAKTRLLEIEEKRDAAQARSEQCRAQITELSAKIAKEKDTLEEMKERRTGLWREDTKLDSTTSRAAEELRTAERTLASMMDKVEHRFISCHESPDIIFRILVRACVPSIGSQKGLALKGYTALCTDFSISLPKSIT
jgi:structural maintenance of chromosome 3 (chondroitin sulfate proteoglycan 6)